MPRAFHQLGHQPPSDPDGLLDEYLAVAQALAPEAPPEHHLGWAEHLHNRVRELAGYLAANGREDYTQALHEAERLFLHHHLVLDPASGHLRLLPPSPPVLPPAEPGLPRVRLEAGVWPEAYPWRGEVPPAVSYVSGRPAGGLVGVGDHFVHLEHDEGRGVWAQRLLRAAARRAGLRFVEIAPAALLVSSEGLVLGSAYGLPRGRRREGLSDLDAWGELLALLAGAPDEPAQVAGVDADQAGFKVFCLRLPFAEPEALPSGVSRSLLARAIRRTGPAAVRRTAEAFVALADTPTPRGAPGVWGASAAALAAYLRRVGQLAAEVESDLRAGLATYLD